MCLCVRVWLCMCVCVCQRESFIKIKLCLLPYLGLCLSELSKKFISPKICVCMKSLCICMCMGSVCIFVNMSICVGICVCVHVVLGYYLQCLQSRKMNIELQRYVL